jgi:protein SCO1/2
MIFTLLMTFLLLQTPDNVITQIGIDQKLGSAVDLDLKFRDEMDRPVRMRQFVGTSPVILMPVYFGCPMLCGMQLNGFVRALRILPFTAGREFEVITFSIDPEESGAEARSAKAHYIRDYGRPAAANGWHFLTGNEESIRTLTDQLGYRYTYDRAIGQWAHSSALIVLTPDGRISQYFNGIEYDPGALKYSLIEASSGKIGSVVDRALLYCYQYNPATGKYSLSVLRAIRVSSVMIVLALALFMVGSRRR